jgi:hypothetical protein
VVPRLHHVAALSEPLVASSRFKCPGCTRLCAAMVFCDCMLSAQRRASVTQAPYFVIRLKIGSLFPLGSMCPYGYKSQHGGRKLTISLHTMRFYLLTFSALVTVLFADPVAGVCCYYGSGPDPCGEVSHKMRLPSELIATPRPDADVCCCFSTNQLACRTVCVSVPIPSSCKYLG